MEWQENTSRLHAFIETSALFHKECPFPYLDGSRLYHLRTVVGLFRLTMHKWGMAPTAAKEETAERVITSCPIYQHLNGARVFLTVDKSSMLWLTDICKPIWWTAFSKCIFSSHEEEVKPQKSSGYVFTLYLCWILLKNFFRPILSKSKDLRSS